MIPAVIWHYTPDHNALYGFSLCYPNPAPQKRGYNIRMPTPFKHDFLIRDDIVFLNHGSYGATPRPVFEKYQWWQRELERQPVEFLGRRATALMSESRSVLAKYLNTDRDDLAYVMNTTIGINILAHSLNLGESDEVLSSDHEYGALDRLWRFLAAKKGFKYIKQSVNLPLTSPEALVDDIWQRVTENTRLIYFSHVTSPTALIFPASSICERARKHGILTLIDGAHAPGQIPLDLTALGADFYSGNLHKWLCGPKGTAFLYARPEVQHLVEPLVVGWGWESERPNPVPFVDHHEAQGTRDISAFLAVPGAIHYQQSHNWHQIRDECHRLACEMRRRIIKLTGLPPICPESKTWFAQMASARLPDHIDHMELQRRLYDEFRIEIPLMNWNGQNLIRFSFQAYNDMDDVHTLEAALARSL
jgi:isopenicillin-N epimerase